MNDVFLSFRFFCARLVFLFRLLFVCDLSHNGGSQYVFIWLFVYMKTHTGDIECTVHMSGNNRARVWAYSRCGRTPVNMRKLLEEIQAKKKKEETKQNLRMLPEIHKVVRNRDCTMYICHKIPRWQQAHSFSCRCCQTQLVCACTASRMTMKYGAFAWELYFFCMCVFGLMWLRLGQFH